MIHLWKEGARKRDRDHLRSFIHQPRACPVPSQLRKSDAQHRRVGDSDSHSNESGGLGTQHMVEKSPSLGKSEISGPVLAVSQLSV